MIVDYPTLCHEKSKRHPQRIAADHQVTTKNINDDERITKRRRREWGDEAMPMDHIGETTPLPSEDEVLIQVSNIMEIDCELVSLTPVVFQMIRQHGVNTHAEVVNFCRSCGIPLSRMFRLNLLGEVQPSSTQR